MKKVLTLILSIILAPSFSNASSLTINNTYNSLVSDSDINTLLINGNGLLTRSALNASDLGTVVTIDTNQDSNGNFTYGIVSTRSDDGIGIRILGSTSSFFSTINVIRGRIVGLYAAINLDSNFEPFGNTTINIGENGSLATTRNSEAIRLNINSTTTINNSGQISEKIIAARDNRGIMAPRNQIIINNQTNGNINGNITLDSSNNSTVNNNGGIITGNISGSNINQVINFNSATSRLFGNISFSGSVNVNENATISGAINGNSLGAVNINGKVLSVGALSNINVLATSASSIILNSTNSINAANINLGYNNAQEGELSFLESLNANNSGQISGNSSSKVNFNKTSIIGGNLIIGSANSQVGVVKFNGLTANDKQIYTFTGNNTAINANNVDFYNNSILNIANTATFNAQTTIKEGSEINFAASNTNLNSSGGFILESNALINTALSSADNLAGNVTSLGAAIIQDGAKLNFTLSSNANNQEIRNYVNQKFVIVQGGENSQIATIKTENLASNDRINEGQLTSNRYKSLIASAFVENNQLILTFSDQKYLITSNKSQQNIYDAIYASSSSNGDLYNLQQFLDSYNSDASKQSALISTMPQSDNAIHRVAFDNNAQIANIISQHLNNFDSKNNKNLWIEILNNNAKQENKSESAGYKNNSFGLIIGLDKEIKDNVLAGVSIGFIQSRINSNDNLKNNDIQSFQGNIYSKFNLEKFFINSNLGFSFNEYETERSIPLTQKRATSAHSGQTYFAQAQLGLNYQLKNDYVTTPFLSLSAARNSVDSYRENNADELNLRVKEKTANLLELRLGGELKKDYLTNFGFTISPKISLSIGHDFIGDEQKTISNFAGENFSFKTNGSKVAQDSVRGVIGVNIFQLNKMNFDANYLFEKRSGYTVNAAQLKASYNF